jgi:hypothetical protein
VDAEAPRQLPDLRPGEFLLSGVVNQGQTAELLQNLPLRGVVVGVVGVVVDAGGVGRLRLLQSDRIVSPLGADSISGSGNATIWRFDRPGLPTLSSYEQVVFGQLEQIHVVFILGSGVVLGEVPASELVEVGARVHGGVQVAQV